MKSPLETLIEQSANIDLFAADSRYSGFEKLDYTTTDGRTVRYLKRRILPKADDLAKYREYTVNEGDRLDLIAWSELGNSLLFWRVCDANNAMNPFELTETVNHKLDISLPEGVPNPTNA